ncbi:MAG: hypothetical protein O6931_06865 [Gammaproteobacteria bacterium]|nr:hypothetical protein [Gammaproteobacteria bacterium]
MIRTTSHSGTHQPRLQSGIAVLIAAGILLAANASAATVSERQFSLPANGLRELRIHADDGKLTVVGNTEIKEVWVRATIRVRPTLTDKEFSDFFDNWLRLTLNKHGRTAQLEATISPMAISEYQPRIDLVVDLPPEMDLIIVDGQGVVEISGMRSEVEVTDGSGKLLIRNIIGNVTIIDEAGSMEISDITGDLQIKDRTGSITAEKVDGTMFLDKRSGQVSIDGLSGDLIIESRLRGELDISDHAGKVIRPD